MDCTQAQEAITAALDRQPVDAEYLAAAKEHCRACPQCGAFVRTQLVVKQMPLPEPSADLADRVMTAIRAEVGAEQPDPATSEDPLPATDVGAPAPLPSARPVEPRATLRAPARRRKPFGRAATAMALVGVAAVMFVAAVSLAVFGSSQISGHKTVTNGVYDSGVPAAPQSTAGGAAQDAAKQPGSATATEGAAGLAGAARFVTLGGSVFTLVGPASIDPSKLTITGVTATSLSSGRSPIQRNVLSGTGPDTIYIADDSNQLLAFTRVTRQFQGATYRLTSAAISAFGVWPSLPAEIPQPQTSDGSPTFVSAGKDQAGVSVYRLATSSATSGIAVAPNTAAPDPSGANPRWTWWIPAR